MSLFLENGTSFHLMGICIKEDLKWLLYFSSANLNTCFSSQNQTFSGMPLLYMGWKLTYNFQPSPFPWHNLLTENLIFNLRCGLCLTLAHSPEFNKIICNIASKIIYYAAVNIVKDTITSLATLVARSRQNWIWHIFPQFYGPFHEDYTVLIISGSVWYLRLYASWRTLRGTSRKDIPTSCSPAVPKKWLQIQLKKEEEIYF